MTDTGAQYAVVKQGLRNVLEYTEHLIATRIKVISDVDKEAVARFHESEVIGLEGIDFNVDQETWLRIHRIRETKPPQPDVMFEGWVDFGPHPSPDIIPTLHRERVVPLSIEAISDLFESGIVADPGDVLAPDASGGATDDQLNVIMRTANMPEFCNMWRSYVDGPWASWAEVERPRRRSIDTYNRLYQIHQRMTAFGEDTPIEMVFGLGIARWRVDAERINIPLIEQAVELEMDETGTISVRPRQFLPQLVMAAFHQHQIEGSEAAQKDVGERFLRMADDPDVGFSPFEKSTFESILRTCSTRLSERGIYHPDEIQSPADRRLPAIDDVLRVSDTWVLYARQRTEDGRRNDIRRLIQRIDDIKDEQGLPPAGARFVVAPSDKLTSDLDDGFIDLISRSLDIPGAPVPRSGGERKHGESGASREKDSALFFPLPYNDEQETIIKRLEDPDADGVLVQGPPGTGKTHTIANIVCHYMATGRRVLVTARTPEALTALQEKIPEGIRDLAIAVIHNDREGARQLDHAVRILADTVKAINPRQVSDDVREKQSRLAQVRDEIDSIDKQLQAFAEKNLTKVRFRGVEVGAMDLAKVVAEERDRHAWFPDASSAAHLREPSFTESDIADLQRLRRRLAGDLPYSVGALPTTAALPPLASVVAAHGELARINEIEGRESTGDIPFMVIGDSVGLDHARRTLSWLRDLKGFMDEVSLESWAYDIYQILVGVKRIEDQLQTRLREEVELWAKLHVAGAAFLVRDIKLDHPPIEEPALDKAIDDYSAGRSPFGVFSMFKGGLKATLDCIEIEGRKPTTSKDWGVIRDYRSWQKETARFAGRWNGFARVAGAPTLPAEWNAAHAEFMRMGRLVRIASQLHHSGAEHRRTLEALFPYGIDAEETVLHGKCAGAIDALAANVERAELSDARALVAKLHALASGRMLPFHAALADFCANLGNIEVPQNAVARAWQDITAEAERLDGLRSDFQRLDELCGKITMSGAPMWAERLRVFQPSDEDPWTPTGWQETWEWARADNFLKSLGNREIVRSLSDRRVAAESEQRRLFAEVIRLRTFLGLKRGLTERIDSALAKFTAAIARLGRGTGQGAPRQRRIIREAAQDAARGIPCWILPEWRVAEQLPSELGVFDLVVVDEASQSDITAFPVILRGRKVLIVGDDKQVSPTVIGIEERQVAQLRATFLSNLPFANQMDPATSLYELGGMVFPGKATMLREHFRCVEPIIRFSSRFYARPLLPLRLPKASERLDPPLVDIYVAYGRKDGEINTAEADVIVAEITKLVRDERYSNRSIGVISLIGSVQATRIYSRLVSDLGAETIEHHRIMCGNAATFQGQERDIVFLSMVACPKTAIAQTTRNIEQRYNVAASRARDRLVLVRSVAASHLKPGDLKLGLIEHFRNPMEGGNIVPPSNVLDLCQSGFERDFGRRVLDMGFRLRPQVPVAGYSIDFVIEGVGDRRLAIELDGDNYHGPDRWADDIRRQKMLERLGWTFWRCWGSSWYVDSEGCLADLLDTLTRLGIEPLGMAPMTAVHTEHITISSPESIIPVDGAAAVFEPVNAGPVEALQSPPEHPASPPETDISEAVRTVVAPSVPADVVTPIPAAGPAAEQGYDTDEETLLTEAGAFAALAAFRDTVIRPAATDWQPNRSILRDGMIETFIRQRVSTSDEWFTKVPQYQRASTEPTEKRLFLDRICAIVGRIEAVDVPDKSRGPGDDFKLTTPHSVEVRNRQNPLPLNGFVSSNSAGQYIPAVFSSTGIEPNPDLLYEASYRPTLRRLVAHVISVEGPIYGDILAMRIARAHGKDRTGSTIQKLVLDAIDNRFPHTREEDRDLFWPEGLRTDWPFPYRRSADGVRSHSDTPLAELASIALPFLQVSLSDEEIIQKMTEHFRLERLRRATRARFEAALVIAQRAQVI